jgi:uncharacterized protein
MTGSTANTADRQGGFVWYELMTTDMEAAKAFYGKVMGWAAQDASAPDMPYTLFIVGRASIAGMMNLPQDAGTIGEKPGWIGFIAVDDVDATAARIKELGGAVYVPPTEIPGISRFSVVADPEMAMFVVIKWLRPRHDQPAVLNVRGRVGWHELLAADSEKASAFYRELFGWQTADAGADGYRLLSVGGQAIGGIYTKAPTVRVPFWLFYFNVGDIDAAAKRVKGVGGEIINGPTKVPDGSWILECADPQGAVFALLGKRSADTVGYFERVTPGDAPPARGRRWSW